MLVKNCSKNVYAYLVQGLIVVDEQLWVEQRRFVLRHLREFGFGRTSMVTIIEDEASKLVDHFKGLLRNNYNYEIADVRKPAIPLNNNTGQIYKLQKKSEDSSRKSNLCEESNEDKRTSSPGRRASTVADLYMKAEDYAEVRRVSQSAGMIMPMHDAFGVTVLNTLWRMMAGKRYYTCRKAEKKKTRLEDLDSQCRFIYYS